MKVLKNIAESYRNLNAKLAAKVTIAGWDMEEALRAAQVRPVTR